jgi:putative oxidoreductase
MAALGLLVLRVVLAIVFSAHGANIIFGAWAGPGIGPGGLAAAAARFEPLAAAPLLAALAGIIQLVGGLLVGMGLLTRSAALALLVYVGFGFWTEHLRWGFFLNWTRSPQQGLGVEYSLVLAGALICLLAAGAGEWSIDGRRLHSRAQRAAGRARLRAKM